MNKRANPTVVGAFVVGALLLLVAGVLLFGSGDLLRERVAVVAFFTGNVRGLQEGSAVEFRGVRVGSVKRIRLLLDVHTDELLIPVHMELETRTLILAGEAEQANSAQAVPFLDGLVAKGLRARLDLKSVVTGQLAVGLDMHPDTPIRRVDAISDVYELPTVPSTLDRVVEALQDLPLQDMANKLMNALDKASRLLGDERLAATLRDAAGTAADTRRLMSELQKKVGPAVDEARTTMHDTYTALREMRAALLDLGQRAGSTLDAYARLAQGAGTRLDSLAIKTEQAVAELGAIRASLDARIAPVADATLATLSDARGTLANVDTLVGEQSRARYKLDVALDELAAAARSLRILADYLEQNPDALLKGKGL